MSLATAHLTTGPFGLPWHWAPNRRCVATAQRSAHACHCLRCRRPYTHVSTSHAAALRLFGHSHELAGHCDDCIADQLEFLGVASCETCGRWHNFHDIDPHILHRWGRLQRAASECEDCMQSAIDDALNNLADLHPDPYSYSEAI